MPPVRRKETSSSLVGRGTAPGRGYAGHSGLAAQQPMFLLPRTSREEAVPPVRRKNETSSSLVGRGTAPGGYAAGHSDLAAQQALLYPAAALDADQFELPSRPSLQMLAASGLLMGAGAPSLKVRTNPYLQKAQQLMDLESYLLASSASPLRLAPRSLPTLSTPLLAPYQAMDLRDALLSATAGAPLLSTTTTSLLPPSMLQQHQDMPTLELTSSLSARGPPSSISRILQQREAQLHQRDLQDASLKAKNTITNTSSSSARETTTKPSAEESWNRTFQRLLNYKARFGNCLVPQRYRDDPRLGEWVHKQRFRKNNLAPERREKLESVGFVWRLFEKESWDTMLQRLIRYKENHGHTLVPHYYKDDPKLGQWVQTQRKAKDTIAPDKRKKLDDIDFVWCVRQHETWDAMLERLIKYKATHGDCRVPQRYPLDSKLGNWVHTQRKRRMILSEAKLEKLEAIGFEWSGQQPHTNGYPPY